MFTKRKDVIIIIGIAALIGFVLLIFSTYSSPTIKKTNTLVSEAPQIQEQTNTSNSFSSRLFGFSFVYPKEWGGIDEFDNKELGGMSGINFNEEKRVRIRITDYQKLDNLNTPSDTRYGMFFGDVDTLSTTNFVEIRDFLVKATDGQDCGKYIVDPEDIPYGHDESCTVRTINGQKMLVAFNELGYAQAGQYFIKEYTMYPSPDRRIDFMFEIFYNDQCYHCSKENQFSFAPYKSTTSSSPEIQSTLDSLKKFDKFVQNVRFQ